jgi:CelD/BcsL family acetyltransferase involved in cellulose biosynthesis
MAAPAVVQQALQERSNLAGERAASAAARAAPFDIRVATSLDDLASIWPTSGDLGDARAHVFQCADVLRVWCDTLGAARGTKPCFVAVLDPHGVPLMLLPLGVERRGGVRVLAFLDGDVSDYNAPILFPSPAAWSEGDVVRLWQALRRALPPFDVAVLEKMPERVADEPNPLLRLGPSSVAVSGHAARLIGAWLDFAAARLPRRADGRRKLRKLEKLGEVSFALAQTPRRPTLSSKP